MHHANHAEEERRQQREEHDRTVQADIEAEQQAQRRESEMWREQIHERNKQAAAKIKAELNEDGYQMVGCDHMNTEHERERLADGERVINSYAVELNGASDYYLIVEIYDDGEMNASPAHVGDGYPAFGSDYLRESLLRAAKRITNA